VTEVVETHLLGIGGVEIRKRVDHQLRQLAIGDGVLACAELGRDGAPHHDAAPTLHHEKGSPDALWVVAEQEGPRREGKDPVQDGEDPVLTGHVVRAGRDGAERRTTQHILDRPLPLAVAEQIGEVRVTARELLHRERLLGTLQPATQVTRQALLVEALVGSHLDQLGQPHGLVRGRHQPDANTGWKAA
jgi:hypothetical protein